MRCCGHFCFYFDDLIAAKWKHCAGAELEILESKKADAMFCGSQKYNFWDSKQYSKPRYFLFCKRRAHGNTQARVCGVVLHVACAPHPHTQHVLIEYPPVRLLSRAHDADARTHDGNLITVGTRANQTVARTELIMHSAQPADATPTVCRWRGGFPLFVASKFCRFSGSGPIKLCGGDTRARPARATDRRDAADDVTTSGAGAGVPCSLVAITCVCVCVRACMLANVCGLRAFGLIKFVCIIYIV